MQNTLGGAATGADRVPHLGEVMASTPQPERLTRPVRVCIVSDDLVGPVRNGGIGTAYSSLAHTLAAAGHQVTLLYTLGNFCENRNIDYWVGEYRDKGIEFVPLPTLGAARNEGSLQLSLTHDIYAWLKQREFDVIHFPEWRGRAYFSVIAKHQGLAFANTVLCVGVHSPTSWHREGNFEFLSDVDEMEMTFMERQCVALADVVISPSAYMLDWMREQGWQLTKQNYVQQNILSSASRYESVDYGNRKITELVFFGRLEQRKGLGIFCDALDRLAQDAGRELQISFLGKSGLINGQSGEAYIQFRARKWPWQVKIHTEMDHAAAMRFLMNPGRLAVIPSLVENSPYTVLECLGAGIPFLASAVGGIPELIAPDAVEKTCFSLQADNLLERIRDCLDKGASAIPPAIEFSRTEQIWVQWHEAVAAEAAASIATIEPSRAQPLVSVCMTHFNRPAYLRQALDSIIAQDYPNFEVILVDDGSTQPEALVFLDALGPLFEERGWQLIRQSNRYLGAARNNAVRHSQGEYLLFMDDDNCAMPHELSTLVAVAQRTGADIVSCLMDVFEGAQSPMHGGTVKHRWLFLGGSPEVGMLRNCFGDANSLISAKAFKVVGGFTEDYGVGHEDWELLARAALMGMHFEIVPEALFWYRVSAAGMLRSTTQYPNYARSLRPYLAVTPKPLRDVLRLTQGLLFANHELRMQLARLQGTKAQPAAAQHAMNQSLPRDKGVGKAASKAKAKPVSVAPVREAAPEQAPANQPATAAETGGAKVIAVPPVEELYKTWISRHTLDEATADRFSERMGRWDSVRTVHVVIDLKDMQLDRLADTIDSLGGQLLNNWRLSVIADQPAHNSLFDELDILHWELVAPGADRNAALNKVVADIAADWVVLASAGDRFAAQFSFMFADYADRHPQWALIYSDEDRVTPDGHRHEANFKPDLNIDLLRSMPYMGTSMALRRDRLLDLGGYAPLSLARHYDIALRMLDADGKDAIGHISDILLHRSVDNVRAQEDAVAAEQGREALLSHLQRNGIVADVQHGVLPGSYFVDYHHAAQPLVSIIVPTRDHAEELKLCLGSLLEKTDYPHFEVLVVDAATTRPEALEFLAQIAQDPRVQVLRHPGEYNFSAINNRAAAAARGDYLLLLSDDTVIIQANWLSRLMAHGQRSDVGIVGARLVFPNQCLQHAGLILGMGEQGVADHAFIGLPMDAPGYMGRAQVVQNLSGVSAACLLIRKSLYLEVDGMDEQRFKLMYNDVDLCLKVMQRDLKIVWTPFVTLISQGALGPKHEQNDKRLECTRREADAMLDAWLPQLSHDAAFNRQLSLGYGSVWCADPDFDTPEAIADDQRPRILGAGLGSVGSWQYRGIGPLQALHKTGRADCVLIRKYEDRIRIPSVVELERMQPQALLLYNTIHEDHLAALQRYQRHSKALRVFGLDDLASELPQKNPFRATLYKDIKKRIRTALSLSDRLIVTTEPLGEAFRGMIDDIRVVPNHLERWRWEGVESRRRGTRKPRVGWAGALQHQGDLELIIDVVKETAHELDWVFLGMCPKEISGHVAEQHPPVPFDDYPAKLASLDLDLAVAPLEYNRFNEAKSNLRLLEYGILGWPVVCTNIHPYQDAPVERVANNTRAWLNAIRARAFDRDAAAAEGERLRQWVVANFMLEDHLDDWLAALSPATESVPQQAVYCGSRSNIIGA